ncbi:MAG: hypothetical protein J1F23_08915 [Oscillospiraceae bacterium]|nr:hypothetical protein [Oscillospiraceae bacterium]
MNSHVNLIDQLIIELMAGAQFKDVSFVVAYENEIKPTPLTKPITALSIKKCEIGDLLTETLDTGEIITTSSRPVKTTVSIDIYMPYSMGGMEGHKLFDKISTFLLFTKKHNISKVICGDADYDKSCQAIVLRSTFVFDNTVSA